MAFKLFKKDKDSNNEVPDVPDMDIPEPPSLDEGDNKQEQKEVPEPPSLDDIPKKKLQTKTENNSNELPEPPKLDKHGPSKTEVPEPPSLDDIPKKKAMQDVPKHPQQKDELPAFPEEDSDVKSFRGGVAKDKEVPEPPAFLSKMDDVKRDMEEGYMQQGTNIVKIDRPIFVEVSDYKKTLKTIKNIEKDAKKSKEIASELNEIKAKREKELEGWDKKLEKIQRKLIFADKILFEEGGVNV
jgi:hypothetical protein